MPTARLARSANRQAVATFVRERRSRLRPEDVGISAGPRRRTPGLRREEVAQLAGVGLTWYTWFEQGRDIRVSADFLERLCRAFRLTAAERSHLFTLSQHRPPPHAPHADARVPDAVRSILATLPDPAYIMTMRWDVVAWNTSAAKAFGFADTPAELRNILRLVFTAPDYRRLMMDWESAARRTLEKFRLDYARADGDPCFEALVASLCRQSTDFARWWPHQDVCGLGEGQKRLCHPDLGDVLYDHATFAVEGSPDLRLVIYARRG